MMRWSNTKTYTEEDMLRMQQEAISRVHDFQTRAKEATGFFDVPPSAMQEYPYEMQEPTIFKSLPAAAYGEAREEIGAEKNGGVIEAESHLVSPAEKVNESISGLMEKLGVDNETMLILGLMFLLYNEKADHFLIMALAYLLL